MKWQEWQPAGTAFFFDLVSSSFHGDVGITCRPRHRDRHAGAEGHHVGAKRSSGLLLNLFIVPPLYLKYGRSALTTAEETI